MGGLNDLLVGLGHLVAAGLAGALVLALYRRVRRQSRPMAALMAGGILLRASAGLTLFLISFLNLPILRGLHSGDGFWELAPDARSYFRTAVRALSAGFSTIPQVGGSPVFVTTLAVWLRLVGASPASGVFLNICLYSTFAFLLARVYRPVGRWREDLPVLLCLLPFSFSPALLVHASQPLKDEFFLVLIGLTFLCALALFRIWRLADRGGAHARWVVGLLVLGGATYGISGVRAYFGIMIWMALVLSALVFAWLSRGAHQLRSIGLGLAALAVVWAGYAWGAGPYYWYPGKGRLFTPPRAAIHVAPAPPHTGAPAPAAVEPSAIPPRAPATTSQSSRGSGLAERRPRSVDRVRELWAIAVQRVRAARRGFENSGGNTNVLPEDRKSESDVRSLLVGLAMTFVPISLVKSAGLVQFAGGRGLLFLTDIDTLFVDASVLAGLALVVRRRRLIGGNVPYAVYALTLGIMTTLLLAYVVTNFGTFFRLRLIAAVPFWLLPLALTAPPDGRKANDRPVEVDAGAADTPVRAGLVALLRCPTCGGELTPVDARSALRCLACGRVVPVSGGIPRFVNDPEDDLARRTQASFGYEWTHFGDWRPSGETNFKQYFGELDLNWLRGRTVLDAGCGMGRHARQVAPYVGRLVAMDFSRAVDQAARNVAGVPNVDCVQADVLAPPFAPGTFDFVYSLGVLHHLTETEGAIRGLVERVKPGGRFRVYLYWKRHGWSGRLLALVGLVRHVTTRLPFRLLRAFCWVVAAALFAIVVLPYRLLARLGVQTASWPLSVYTAYPFRVLYNDQFDRFSAPLEKRYDADEVARILRTAGLVDVRVWPSFGWIGEGVRPEDKDVACAASSAR